MYPETVRRTGAFLAFAAALVLRPADAGAQTLTYTPLDYGTDSTFLTGIRGPSIVGQDVIANGGGNGGLLYSTSSQAWTPYPVATPSGINLPGAIDNTPYGPGFGSYGGVLRVVGSYQTTASSPYDLGYLYDSAGAPGSQSVTLQYPNPANDTTLFTIPHSTFGDQVVGNYDTRLITGNAFLYTISTGTYASIDKPGAVSTTAYGIWGDHIAGGYAAVGDAAGVTHGYIYDETTGAWTSYDHPGALVTHFEGISGGGRAGTYNLVTDWVGYDGQQHAAILHIDAAGNQTWIELSAGSGGATSANSLYGDTAIGVYVDSTGTHGYVVQVPGIYNPLTNNGLLATAAAGTPAIAGTPGDDVLNNGSIVTSGAGSPGIRSDTYGVVTNNGTVAVSGAGSAAVELDGAYGTLLNNGTLTAAAGATAIASGSTAIGTLVVNGGTIDGLVSLSAGPLARFENSGWLGISAPGVGASHQIAGTFVQTASGTLDLRVAASGTHDALAVAGTARLDGTLTLTPQPGLYAASTSYAVLVTASTALTGGFATVRSSSPFFQVVATDPVASVGAVATRVGFASLPGLTQNQRAVGAGLEQAYDQAVASGGTASDSTLLASVVTATVPAASVPGGYDALGGEGLAGSQQALIAVGDGFVETIREQGALWLAAGPSAQTADTARPAGSWRGWSTVGGGGGGLSADAGQGAAGLAFGAWGGSAGIDYAAADNLLVGLALGGAGASFSVADRQTTGSAGGGQGAMYALGRWNGFYASGVLAYGNAGVTTSRGVAALGQTATTTASYDAGLWTGRLEGGYRVVTSHADVTPFVAYQPSWVSLPGYTESVSAGSAPVGLTVQSKTATAQPLSFGVQIDRAFALGEAWTLTPTARVAWAHDFATGRGITASLSQAPAATFQVDGASAPHDTAQLGLTVSAAHGTRLALMAGIYAGLSGSGQAVAGNLSALLTW